MSIRNTVAVLTGLVKSLKAPVTRSSIVYEIEKHPFKNTLFAISDVLTYWKIPNGAYNVSVDDFKELPLPFIAHLTSNNGEFVLVESVTSTEVIFSNERWTSKTLPAEKFAQLFDGSVLAAEADNGAGEPGYAAKRRKEILELVRIPFLALGTLAVLLAVFFSNYAIAETTVLTVGLILLKCFGLILSVLLIIKTIDSKNPFVAKLCSGGDKLDCDSVISSKAAKLSEEVSWAEVGLFYFTGGLLFLMMNPSPNYGTLYYLNILALPYTFYSIGYQAFAARRWCILCCLVQAALWAEFFILQSQYDFYSRPDLMSLIDFAVAFIVPVLIWVFVKPFLIKSLNSETLQSQLSKFIYNDELFRKLLLQQKNYKLLDSSNSIILGNPDAANLITVVSNPTCQPCAETHKLLHNWLNERENLKVQVVFSTGNAGEEPKVKAARHFMSMYQGGDDKLLKEALLNWYEEGQNNFNKWAKVYPLGTEEKGAESLERQKAWCEEANIKATPAVFYNGYELPDPWRLEDLKYFI